MAMSKKMLGVIGCLVLALVVTGGIFAYGALTATVTANVTAKPDFFKVEAKTQPTWDWTTYGEYIGATGSYNNVFKLTPGTGFTGDVTVQVYITNVDKLIKAYSVLGLNLKITGIAADGTTPISYGPEFISLERPVTEIKVSGYKTNTPLYLHITSGFYTTWGYPWAAGSEDPTLFCQVIQRGA